MSAAKKVAPLALALGAGGVAFGVGDYLWNKYTASIPRNNTVVPRTFGALEGRVNAELMGRGLGDHDLDK